MFASTNAPSVNHVTHKDSAITHFARMSRVNDDFYCGFHELITAHDGQSNTLYDIR